MNSEVKSSIENKYARRVAAVSLGLCGVVGVLLEAPVAAQQEPEPATTQVEIPEITFPEPTVLPTTIIPSTELETTVISVTTQPTSATVPHTERPISSPTTDPTLTVTPTTIRTTVPTTRPQRPATTSTTELATTTDTTLEQSTALEETTSTTIARQTTAELTTSTTTGAVVTEQQLSGRIIEPEAVESRFSVSNLQNKAGDPLTIGFAAMIVLTAAVPAIRSRM